MPHCLADGHMHAHTYAHATASEVCPSDTHTRTLAQVNTDVDASQRTMHADAQRSLINRCHMQTQTHAWSLTNRCAYDGSARRHRNCNHQQQCFKHNLLSKIFLTKLHYSEGYLRFILCPLTEILQNFSTVCFKHRCTSHLVTQ